MIQFMDFTLSTYKLLLTAIYDQGFSFQTFEQFMASPQEKVVILRHDVDEIPVNALRLAKLEFELGIKATYYFRILESSMDPSVITRIANMGHEIGYHYEDYAMARGDLKKAIKTFSFHLEYFRNFYPVKTICMHGSPLSRWDNRLMWKTYDYHDFGIIGEPYFDVNFKEVFYITDTGRKWNNTRVSVRDRVQSGFDISIKNSFHLMEHAQRGALPSRMMITVHPQRWHDSWWPWGKEIVGQSVKNIIKYLLVTMKGDH